MKVNTDKTVVRVCQKGPPFDLSYKGEKLQLVKQFTYLVVSLSYNGKYYNIQKRLSEQVRKALFSLNSLFEQISLNLAEKANCLIQ